MDLYFKINNSCRCCSNPFCFNSQPWSSSRKKPSREEREALKQRKKEEKKSREDEKRQKRMEKKKRKDREKYDKFFESRQKKVNNFTYFAQPLDSICDPGSYVPVFIDKCIEFVENSGELHNSFCRKQTHGLNSRINRLLLG